MSDALHVLFGPDLLAAFAATLLRANLVLGCAIALVAVLRLPLRRVHGPSAAYILWFVPLVAAGLAMLSVLFGGAGRDPITVALSARPELLHALVAVWAGGLAVVAGWFAFLQAQFLTQVRLGRGGPAVVGFIAPRIVMPSELDDYSASERELIRAHEREHVARKDPRAVAIAALLQIVCWFNPLVHLAAALLRLDQELACDAAVVLKRPGQRASYARTLLKSHLMGVPLPLACHWAPLGRHPLEVRIAQLKRTGAASSQSAVYASASAIRP